MGNKRKPKEIVPSKKVPDEEIPFAHLKELGPYRIKKLLGHGGMGYVFKAQDTRDRETVAIKLMAPDFSMDESMIKRFEREANILKSLDHRGIVRILDVNMKGEHKYYVMDFIRGRTLAEELREGALPADEVLGIAWQVAEALGTAHEAGIIHRDIKPANIMRDPTGTIKLTDFGIARVIGAGDATKAGKFLGTPAYMSPEQVLGKELGTASDIYSLGVVLYEMLTGKAPFESSNPLDVMRRHVYEEPVPPKELNPEVPAILSDLVMRMLKKKREERISNPKILESQLQECVRSMHGDVITATSEEEFEEETKRDVRFRLLKYGLLLCAIGLAIFLVLKPGGGLRGFIRRYLMPTTDEATIKESVSKIKKPFLRARASLKFLERGDTETFDRFWADFQSCSIPEKRKLLLIMGQKKIPLTILLVHEAQAEEDLRQLANEALINFGDSFFSSLMQEEVESSGKLDLSGSRALLAGLEVAQGLSERWASRIIEAGMKSDDPMVRVKAISVLEKKGTNVDGQVEEIMPSIVEMLERGGEDINNRLLGQLAELSSPGIRAVQKDIVSGKYKVGERESLFMAKALAFLGDSSGVDILRQNLENPDPFQRTLAYQGMLALDEGRFLRRMKWKLSSAEPLISALFASELFVRGDKKAESLLREFLEDSNWQVRHVAIGALAKSGDEKVLELLEQDLSCAKGSEGYPARIYGAMKILGECGGGQILGDFCFSCDAEFDNPCIRALAKLGWEDSAEVFVDIISGSDEVTADGAKVWAEAGLLHLISKWIESGNTR